MYRSHLPLIALVALAGACAPPSDTHSPEPLVADSAELGVTNQSAYKGVYLLASQTVDSEKLAAVQGRSFVDGIAMRTSWQLLDTGTSSTGPKYDFSSVTSAIEDLHALGKKLTLTIEAQLVPDYVLDAARAAGHTYLTVVPDGTEPQETAVPWDSSTLSSYSAFMHALAYTRVCLVGNACVGTIYLKDHPALAGLRINIIGIGKLRQGHCSEIFKVPDYSRSTFIEAVKSNIHKAHDEFIKTSSWIPYFSVDDRASEEQQTQSLDDALLSAITTEFNGSSNLRPKIGFFQELLKGDSPPDVSTNGKNLLKAIGMGGFTTFQACGGWKNHSLCTFAPGDDTPENGFDLAYGTYGTQYYEIYSGDLTNQPWEDMFTKWDAFIKDPIGATNPVNLSATAGPSPTKNVLTWTDTSTIETNVIVERLGSDGEWTTRATLPANSTGYTDTVERRTTYTYRVHSVGEAGTFVVSNERTVNGR